MSCDFDLDSWRAAPCDGCQHRPPELIVALHPVDECDKPAFVDFGGTIYVALCIDCHGALLRSTGRQLGASRCCTGCGSALRVPSDIVEPLAIL